MRRRVLVVSLALVYGCKGGEAPPSGSATASGSGSASVVKVEQALDDIVATGAEVLGTVEVRRKGQPHWEPMAIGATLRERDWVRVGKGSFARIRFGKRGFLDLREDTTILVDTAISVEAGSFVGVAEPGGDPLVVKTGDGGEARIAAEAGADAAEFRVMQGKDKALEIAVTKGSVRVTTKTGERTVNAGQATDVTQAGASEVVQLIPYPRSVSPGIDARFQFVAGKPIKLAWQPVKDALRYQVQIARDTDFRQLVMSAEGVTTSTTFVPDKPGMYAWRVAARDKDERLGEYGFARRMFVEQEPPRDLLLAPPDNAKVGYADQYPRIEFSWQSAGAAEQYKLVIGKGAMPTVDTVATIPTVGQKVEVATLRDGSYRWGVYAVVDGHEQPIFISPRVLTIRRQRVKAHTENLWDDDQKR